MRAFALLFAFAATITAHAANSLDRLVTATAKAPEWQGARSQAERLQALRKQALKYAAVSDLVSDRYVVTNLAGTVDLVRFFNLARIVCEGADRRTVLLQQWRREHADSLAAGNPPPDAELSPDDLPSNALGALFGEETKAHNKDLGYDLVGSLQKFFAALEPVPDEVTSKIAYERLVLGLDVSPSAEARRKSRAWVTAEPLYLLPAMDAEKAKTIPNATAALKTAGLEVRKHQGHPMVIERVGTPEPEAKPVLADASAPPAAVTEEPPQKQPDTPIGHLFMRPPESAPLPQAAAQKFPKAVVVPEYPKAVPVRETPPAAKKPAFPKAVPVKE